MSYCRHGSGNRGCVPCAVEDAIEAQTDRIVMAIQLANPPTPPSLWRRFGSLFRLLDIKHIPPNNRDYIGRLQHLQTLPINPTPPKSGGRSGWPGHTP